MIVNKSPSRWYVSLLEGMVDFWESKWAKEHNDKLYLEDKLGVLENMIRAIKKESGEEDKSIGEYVSRSYFNSTVYYWEVKWAKEHDDRIRLEERLKFAESTIRSMKKEAEESGYD